MQSTGSVLLAAYVSATAADQRLEAPALHSMNNRKLLTAEFTAATRGSEPRLSAG